MRLMLTLPLVFAISIATAGIDDVLTVSTEDGVTQFSRSARRFELLMVEGFVVRDGERLPYRWLGRMADGAVSVDGELEVERVDVDWYSQMLPVDEQFGRRMPGPGRERMGRAESPPEDTGEEDETATPTPIGSTVTDWSDGRSGRGHDTAYYMFASEHRAAAVDAERRAEARRVAAAARRDRERSSLNYRYYFPFVERPATAGVRYNTGSAHVDSLTVHRFGGNLSLAEAYAIGNLKIP